MNDDKFCEDLKIASSIAVFEATSTDVFRRQLESTLIRVRRGCLVEQLDVRSILHYKPASLVQVLWDSVEWSEILRHHDERKQISDDTTPLQEILTLLQDPRVMPVAFVSVQLRVLVRAFLVYSSSEVNKNETRRRTTCQQLLLQSLQRLMVMRQFKENFGSIIFKVFEEDFRSLDPTFRIRQSMLSLMKYWIKELKQSPSARKCDYNPLLEIFPYLMRLAQVVLAEGKEICGRTSPDDIYCSTCGHDKTGPAVSRKGRRGKGAMDLEALHNDDEILQSKRHMTLQHRFLRPHDSEFITLKTVVHGNIPNAGIETCPHCNAMSEHSSVEKSIVKAWCHARDKCIHTLITFCLSAGDVSRLQSFELLHSSLTDAACDSSDMRVCVLQLVHTLGRDAYGYFLFNLWNFAWDVHVKYLTWYAEVIAEASFCDDRTNCWEAMRPLANSLKDRCEKFSSNSSNGNDDAITSSLLLPCFGYILSRRRRLLNSISSDTIHQEFSTLINHLAWSYGEVHHWITQGTEPGTTQQIVLTLQQLGVLGVQALLGADDLEQAINVADTMEGNVATALPSRRFTTPRPGPLRRAFSRLLWSPLSVSSVALPAGMATRYNIDWDLLSDPKHEEKHSVGSEKPANQKKSLQKVAPILQHFSPELIRHILSFLGYKKLVRVHSVCKVWNVLAQENRLWFPLYRSRFGMLAHDECRVNLCQASSQAPGLWKARFIGKWLTERDIRFRWNEKVGYKHRMCGFIGCHHILKSPAGEKRHYAQHKEQKIQTMATRETKRKRAAVSSYNSACKNDSNQKKSRPTIKQVKVSTRQPQNPP